MRTPLMEQPDCYREGGGGGGLGKFLNKIENITTFGLSNKLQNELGFNVNDPLDLFGGTAAREFDKAEEEAAAEAARLKAAQPTSISTGNVVASGGPKSFDENDERSSSSRSTARRGTTKFRIPIANAKAGARSSGGTGLKI